MKESFLNYCFFLRFEIGNLDDAWGLILHHIKKETTTDAVILFPYVLRFDFFLCVYVCDRMDDQEDFD